jgi:hypothetical protein
MSRSSATARTTPSDRSRSCVLHHPAASTAIGRSGAEIEGRITKIADNVLHVKVKATPWKALPKRCARSA